MTVFVTNTVAWYALFRRFLRDLSLKMEMQGLARLHFVAGIAAISDQSAAAAIWLLLFRHSRSNRQLCAYFVCLLCCMFYFAQYSCCNQHIGPAIPEEEPIFPSEGSTTRSVCTFGYRCLFSHGCPKATIWGQGGVGSNGQNGESPFQPDDVLAGCRVKGTGKEIDRLGGGVGKFRLLG